MSPGATQPSGTDIATVQQARRVGVALLVLGIVVVLPATALVGALFHAGLCWEGCTGVRDQAGFLFVVFPVAYGLAAARYVRKVRRDGPPKDTPPGVQVAVALLLGLVVTLSLLVGTCFALLALLEGS